MKLFVSILYFFLLFALSSMAASAQTQTVSDSAKATSLICNQELFEKVENSYNQRVYNSELHGRAEREIKEINSNCDDSYWIYQAKEYLKIVEEESAERDFMIAQYYWKQFQLGKITHFGGVTARLKKITEKYPNYSQIIAVKEMFEEADINAADARQISDSVQISVF